MNQALPMGANAALRSAKGKVTVRYEYSNTKDISLTAFLLTDSGVVQGDAGIIFFNQPKSESGAASLLPTKEIQNTRMHTIDFDMSKFPAGITKIAITLTEDNGTGFSDVRNLKAKVYADQHTTELIPMNFNNENGIVVLELYVRNGVPKVKSVWRGFDSGLEGLCNLYGVEVEPEEPSKVPQPVNGIMEKETPKTAPIPSSENKKTLTSVNLEKVKGKISLDKGQKSVLIDKTPEITATVSWKSGTDYDIYALVYTKEGRQVDVAMFGAQGTPPLKSYGSGAVEHMGDVGRNYQRTKTEIIKLRLTDDIVAVVPVVYSAQSNGTGSFYKYKVSMTIDNHNGTNVTISAKNANNNNRIYTCVPGILHNTPDGVIISPLEFYSKQDSEFRPKLRLGRDNMVEVLMDEGPRNNYK